MKDFLSKVGAFFKKVGSAIVKAAKVAGSAIAKAAKVAGCAIAKAAKVAGSAIAKAAKYIWNLIKIVPWTKPIKPVIAWSVIGGTLAIAVALMLIFWL